MSRFIPAILFSLLAWAFIIGVILALTARSSGG